MQTFFALDMYLTLYTLPPLRLLLLRWGSASSPKPRKLTASSAGGHELLDARALLREEVR